MMLSELSKDALLSDGVLCQVVARDGGSTQGDQHDVVWYTAQDGVHWGLHVAEAEVSSEDMTGDSAQKACFFS